jgi:hypothetical protein
MISFMYFQLFVNEEDVGTFGHADVENLTISVSGSPDGAYIFAGAVCKEGGRRFHYHWLQKDIGQRDEVRVAPVVSVASGIVPVPLKKFEMGRTERKAWEANLCEFCQRNETQVKRLIRGDANRPGICSDCVQMCNDILDERP